MDSNLNQYFQEENNVDVLQEIKKYLRYWPWFVITLFLSLLLAYLYLRYTPNIYQTNAKIKILDESEGLELPTSAFIFKRSNINLENEIEILKSYLISKKVVKRLNLTSQIQDEGTIITSPAKDLPFFYQQVISTDSIHKRMKFHVKIEKGFIDIRSSKDESLHKVSINDTVSVNTISYLPFKIIPKSGKSYTKKIGKKYIINIKPLRSTALSLRSRIKIKPLGETSDLLELSMDGQEPGESEKILNTLIKVFDEDGIYDRQLISIRTLKFIEDRFVKLALELDSIEVGKQQFKQKNELIDIEVNAESSIQLQNKVDEQVFKLENQIALSDLISQTLVNNDFKLLPADVGIENSELNGLIAQYNSSIIKREKLIVSGGINNPSVKLLDASIVEFRKNIKNSIINYKKLLDISKKQLDSRNYRFKGAVNALPQKEKLLREIERQQKIKESLYLLLLQKREEAAINLAITEPSIKVVEYALSKSTPISPKGNIIYSGAFLIGLLLPFGMLYLIFSLDNKVQTKDDLSKLNTNVEIIGEIPDIRNLSNAIFENPNDRSTLSESFRILSSNVNYMLPSKNSGKGKVIYCTSTIKGEGKTYVSVNLSLALSSINRKVLLIGADLRNPQIHTHLNVDKRNDGLTNYLHDESVDWRKITINGFEKHNGNHHTIISGPIPPNPAHLLTNGRFRKLIEEAREEYDYIIVDTAPTILVTDTMLISQLADATLYITRANFTEKKLLNFSEELRESGKLKNMAYVINAVGANKSYNYSYNYGYGYGYSESDS